MPVENLPIFCFYDKQRFSQFGAMDCANWYGIAVPTGKKQQALYPAMGRRHVNILGQNKLIFDNEPRAIFKTIDFMYAVVGTRVYKIDKFYNTQSLGNISLTGNVWFAFTSFGNVIYAILTDEMFCYLIKEDGSTVTMEKITDVNAPTMPEYVASFGNRFVVSQKGTPDNYISTIELNSTPATYFTINGAPIVFRASGIVGQYGVLHNQLYIFSDYQTDVWSNIPTQFTVAGATFELPFKLNTSYNFDYGIADPFSLDIDFGRMVWLAKNSNGLVSFVSSTGQMPQDISTQAINVILEKSSNTEELSPFLTNASDGFLYQYENTIFYRVSAGKFLDFGELDLTNSANSLEYNFETQTWSRVIELNGERNRIQKHVFYNNKHLVTVEKQIALFEMSGDLYYNELQNPAQTNPQATDAFLKYPMRYELVTPAIYNEDYSEFITNYVEIDFVFGDKTFYKANLPFDNTVYLVDETSTPSSPVYLVDETSTSGSEVFLIEEGTNTPSFSDNHYYALFKPHIELYYSNDGGVTFTSSDVREFSPLGQYRWRMRWYELGVSRNRCYKLVCVSSAPVVILGAVQNRIRVSGGAN